MDPEDLQEKTLYEILEVPPNATKEEIRKAYRRQALKYKAFFFLFLFLFYFFFFFFFFFYFYFYFIFFFFN